MIRIDKLQLFSLVILFLIGSTTFITLGIDAKQDAWIAILLASIGGIVLVYLYTEFNNLFPGKNLAEIINILLGKVLGVPLIVLYCLYFLFICLLILGEVGHAISVTALQSTPLSAIMIIFMLTVCYILFLGIEVFARTSQIMCISIILFLSTTYILTIFSQRVDLSTLTPVLGDGIVPVIEAAFPGVLTFPFGDMVVFTMYWGYVKEKQSIRKTAMYATIVASCFLVFSSMITIATLGPSFAANTSFSFLEVIKLINIANILTNLDGIGVSIIFIGSLYKVIIMFYGSILGFSYVLKFDNPKSLIIPIGVCVLLFTLNLVPNTPFLRWFGSNILVRIMHIIFQIFIPLVLLFIAFVNQTSSTKKI